MTERSCRNFNQRAGHRAPARPVAFANSSNNPYAAGVARRPSRVRTVAHGAGTAVMALAIALAVALVGVRLLGLDVYAVLSGSMEPTYRTGSVIYVKSCEPEDVQVGDPITFVLNEDLVVATHRVVSIDEDAREFVTKGDANEVPDGAPVLFENLLGKPVFSIPYLGYLVAHIQEPPGTYVAIAICALLIMLAFLPDLFAKDEKESVGEREIQQYVSAPNRAGRGRHARIK